MHEDDSKPKFVFNVILLVVGAYMYMCMCVCTCTCICAYMYNNYYTSTHVRVLHINRSVKYVAQHISLVSRLFPQHCMTLSVAFGKVNVCVAKRSGMSVLQH